MTTRSITKILSANDLSETGAHQAGILIPKDPRILSFFPQLDASKKNPRVHLVFEDDGGSKWEFAFIYYNNYKFGGTRNEYRLTRMTRFLRSLNLTSGEDLHFSIVEGAYHVSSVKKAESSDSGQVLVLRSGWKVVQI